MKKDDKIIKIKNPKLQRVRLGFRQVLLQESKERLSSLLDEEKEFLDKRRGKSYDQGYFSYLRFLADQKARLRSGLSASIIVCAICRDIENDHIFSLRDKIWYCFECYDVLEKAYLEGLEALKKLN